MGISAPWRRSRDLGGDAAIDPGRDPRAALELRVHGVHGTSPSSMLGVKDPRQVAGDGITGVFRAEKGLPRRVLRPEHAVEAYSWGALTSAVRGAFGWVQRVLWLGLLPFALINLAYWARLHVGVDDRRGRWGAAAVRWAALLLTMLYVLAASFLSLDLVAWQCYRGGTKSCDVLPGLLDFMMFLAPSQRLAVAAMVPLAGVGLMWFLSRHTLTRYEACLDSHRMSGGQHLLQDKRFWSSTRRTVRLQRIHLAAAFATLATYVGAQVDRLAERPSAWTLAAIAILLVCFAAAARLHPQDLEVPRAGVDADGPHDRWAVWLLGLSVVIVLTQMLWLFLGAADASRGWDSTLGWFGHNLWFIGVFVLLSAVNIAVFVAGRLSAFPSTLTIVLFIAGVGIAAWLSLGGSRETSRTEVWLILAVSGAFAAAFYVTMLVWQLRQGRPEQGRRAEAWNGAGAAVLIGAAGWIALLFVTAAVTAASNYLNGPDQSVSDLTSYQPAVKESVTPKEVAEAEPDLVFSLAKGAVLRDGILVAGETPQIVRGSVMVETAEITRRRPAADPARHRRAGRHPPDGGHRAAARRHLPRPRGRERPRVVPPGDAGVRLRCRGDGERPGAGPGHGRTRAARGRGTAEHAARGAAGADLGADRPGDLGAARRRSSPSRAPYGSSAASARRSARLVERQKVPTESRVDVTNKRLRAAYAHRAERLIELLGAVTVGAVLVLLCLSATGLPPNALVSTLFPEWRSDLPHLVASLSLYVVLGPERRADPAEQLRPALGGDPQGGRHHLGPDDLLAAGGPPAEPALLRRARGAGDDHAHPVGARAAAGNRGGLPATARAR